MPLLPITSPSTLVKCKHYPATAQDIFICSYPKSGTTWTQCIIHQLLAHGRECDGGARLEHISDVAPFYEVDRTWENGSASSSSSSSSTPTIAQHYREKQAALVGRPVFNTHLRWDMMPGTSTDTDTNTHRDSDTDTDQGPRYIYLMRDGRDVCVSYYHHLKSMRVEDGGFEGDFHAFFTQWVKGEIVFGGWVDHLVSWVGGAARKDARVLFLRYEDLKEDLVGCLGKMARHCNISLTGAGGGRGEEGEGEEAEAAVLAKIASKCSFAYMQSHREVYEPRSVAWRDKDFHFIRKGQVGDHKAHFTPAQHQTFAAMLYERFGRGEEGGAKKAKLPAYIVEALVGGEASLARD